MSALSIEALTTWSVDGRAVPRLAARWNWENDGRRLRVTIRDGVTFHDGTPFNATIAAEAVSAAIARPGNRALYPAIADVTSVKADGDLDLVFDLSQPSAFLPEDLEFPLSIGPNNTGTGPYRLVKDDPSELVLERVDNYHLGTPTIAQVVLKPFRTLRTAWTSLLRGEVDMVTDVPAEAVEFVSNDDVQVVRFARQYQYLIAFNSKRLPFSNSTVRRALNLAIDREALIQNVLQGRGTPATGPIWPRHWAYDHSVGPYRYDPGVVASLLDSAGLHPQPRAGGPPSRLRFTCLIPESFTVTERVGLEIQRQLYNVGIDMQFEVIPARDFNQRVSEGRFEAMLIDLISGTTVERGYQFWRSAKAHQGLNVFGYENAEAERFFDVLRTTTNEAAVRTATSRLQRVLLDDPPALFIAWNERARAVGRNFNVVLEEGRDPLHTLWRWTENSDRRAQSTQ